MSQPIASSHFVHGRSLIVVLLPMLMADEIDGRLFSSPSLLTTQLGMTNPMRSCSVQYNVLKLEWSPPGTQKRQFTELFEPFLLFLSLPDRCRCSTPQSYTLTIRATIEKWRIAYDLRASAQRGVRVKNKSERGAQHSAGSRRREQNHLKPGIFRP
jgi:hypothetical protein